ncbi:MAG: lamin tail domain-containing protein, partial [Candidatus Magasanikbacteria bacterium]|nr:lamin tail domain-containing protein [Candidatus Magasanikbacteria bacterium]
MFSRRRIVLFLGFVLGIFLGSAILIGRVFVYDTNVAHPGLSKLAGELYNQNLAKDNLPALTAKQINWLMQGAIEEDTPLRWMNHFYDPVYNLGFKGFYDSVKVWAKDIGGQVGYSKGNNTWQEAIYSYQKGDNEKAFIALGHILHLIEDLTVPAHTRDDAHPTGDPYEQWVKNNFQPLSAQPIYFNQLDKHFDCLANYSNNNFYSEDTIESKKFNLVSQSSKKIGKADDDKTYWFVYAETNDTVYPLFHYKFVVLPWKQDLPQSNWSKTVKDSSILSSHFSLLAPKAIGAGAGVIKLFFEETQKQQTYSPPFWNINPLGLLQESGAMSAETLGRVFSNAKNQLGNLADAAKEMLLRFGDKTTNIDFLSELWKTQTALALDLQELSQAKSALASLPWRIVAETSQGLERAFSDKINSPASAPAPASAPKQLAVAPVASVEESVPLPTSPSLPEDLSQGFLKKPVVSPPSLPNPLPPVPTPLPAGNPSHTEGGSYSFGGGSSSAASSPAPATNQAAPSSSANETNTGAGPSANTNNTSAGSADSNASVATSTAASTTSTPANSPSPDTTPPAPPAILIPAISPFYTTGTAFTVAVAVSEDTAKLYLNNQPITFAIFTASTTPSTAASSTSTTTLGSIFQQDVALTEGKNIFDFWAADAAGNQSASTTAVIFKDTTPPQITLQAQIVQSQHAKILLNWNSDDGAEGSGAAGYEIFLKKRANGASTSTNSGEWEEWLTAPFAPEQTTSTALELITSTQAEFAGEEGYEYIFRARAQDKLGNVSEWVETPPLAIETPRVVINEIAWGGTQASANDEWMELYNGSDFPVDLSGWTLSDNGDININFSSSTNAVIPARGFYLLERTSDQTIATLAANYIYKGSLKDSGEKLELRNVNGRLIDEVNCRERWFAGRNAYERASMERKNSAGLGSDPANWKNTTMAVWRAQDADGAAIAGTPAGPNSSLIFLSGELSVSRTLFASLSPYLLGDLTVASGTVLSIEPGVAILGGPSSDLFIYGEVRAAGAA